MTKARDLSFIDKAHAFTFARRATGDAQPLNEATQAVARRLRMKLRDAEKFTLDDEAVRLVCRLSHEFDRIEAWSLLARLPYDCIWVDFDLHVKVREFAIMNKLGEPFNPAEVAKRIGYLMFRDTTANSQITRWVCHAFLLDNAGEVLLDMLAYVYDSEGDPQFPTRGSQFWRSPTLSLRPGFPRCPVTIAGVDGGKPIEAECDAELMLGGVMEAGSGSFAAHLKGDAIVLDDPGAVIGAPPWLTSRMAVIVEPWWDAHLDERQKLDMPLFHKLILTATRENRGQLRWIITFLAALGGLPKDIQRHAARAGKHSVGMHQLPYFGTSTIRLDIPREDRIVHSRRLLDKEAGVARKRRRHKVIGHWRIVQRSSKLGFLCRHVPKLQEKGLALCERCGLLVRYVESYERGDATLGYVSHQYEGTPR